MGLYLQLVAEILIFFPLSTKIHMYDIFPALSVLLNSGSFLKYPQPSKGTQKHGQALDSGIERDLNVRL